MLHSIDIIIPCFNEEKNLKRLLSSIAFHMQNSKYPYSVIVVDNGSDDGSPEIAVKNGARLIVKPFISVAALRNEGVASTDGEILVFLDADVEITSNWVDTLNEYVKILSLDPMIITGATVLRPAKCSLLEKLWFNGKNFSKKYINSGNLITTRKLFSKIGGFDSKLSSGEDCDICKKAKSIGGQITHDANFIAYHHGFPKDLLKFYNREKWHGKEDFKTFHNFFNSKPAIIGLFNILFFFSTVFLIIIEKNLFYGFLYILWLISIGLFIAIKRSEKRLHIFGNLLIAIVYIFARGLAIIETCTSK